MKPGITGFAAKADEPVQLVPASADDAEALVALRTEAMRPSLERVGRFDPQRSRERFLSSFAPSHTRWIVRAGERVGFVVVRPQDGVLLLDHLYIRAECQGLGIGREVLAAVFEHADATGQALRVGALVGSDSNRFYARHGFVLVEQTEWDNCYLRQPRALS